jgi:acetyl-CoA carboxylase biotin carboxyl carrier protein
MTDLKTLKQLIRLMVENDLTELDLEGEGEKVKLKRGNGSPEVHYVAAPPGPSGAIGNPLGAPRPATDAAPPAAVDVDAGLTPIRSPMVGTFYAAASPDAKPFVSAGDRVSPDTVVCIIEAMKVFNEIKAEVSGIIERVGVSSGQSVEFDQPLFMVRPA